MNSIKPLQTIYKTRAGYSDYPFEKIQADVLDLAYSVKDKLNKSMMYTLPLLLKKFECFLQITDSEKVDLKRLSQPDFEYTGRMFIGALFSTKFAGNKLTRANSLSAGFLGLLSALEHRVPSLSIPSLNLSGVRLTSEATEIIELFESLPLNSSKVEIWTGWWAYNKNDMPHRLQLLGIYQRLGPSFTRKICEICGNYLSRGQDRKIIAIPPLDRFIKSYPGHLPLEAFRDSLFVSTFMRDFFNFYIIDGYKNGKGKSVSTLITDWRNNIVFFIIEWLIEGDLFVKPLGTLPSPSPKFIKNETNIRIDRNGKEINQKLLTEIPLHVTDEQAIELLFNTIEKDFELIKKWARDEIESLYNRYSVAKTLAKEGTIIPKSNNTGTNTGSRWLFNPKNPDYLKNIAASFYEYGFQARSDYNPNLLYSRRNLDGAAHLLGLPTSYALIPHAIMLVANHPRLTPSALSKLELFDKNGKQTGFIEIDSGWVLDTRKDRKGPLKSQDLIVLDKESQQIVHQILDISETARHYLKEIGSDHWRRLFLSCGRAFSEPKPVCLQSFSARSNFINVLARGLAQNDQHLSKEDSYKKAKSFTLSKLRASAGVMVYLKTQSTDMMSKALGHSSSQGKLLRRYLPEPLKQFFQDRWVKIFQQGLIVNSLKSSQYLLEATTFNSMHDLHTFLGNHALKTIPRDLENFEELDHNESIPNNSVKTNEIIFSVDVGIFTTLLSLNRAVTTASRPVCAEASYWATITTRLVNYIESDEFDKDEIRKDLLLAKENINPKPFEELIYDQS